jgi:hypothetical protein
MKGILIAALLVVLGTPAWADPFVEFPKAGELISPDGRFLVRSAEISRPAGDFVGAFRSLWLVEAGSGRARKLCDYWGTTMVGWSGNGFLIVTQYMSKKTSRTLLFSVEDAEQAVVLDTPRLIQLLPSELRETLRDNDHVFIEGSRMEQMSLSFRVWGYGHRDTNGFRWQCKYGVREGSLFCTPEQLPATR